MRVSIIATSIVVVAFAWLPSFVDARRAPRPPGTGLAHVAFGRPPPDFAFPSDGATTRLSNFAGRPVVLNFWASWCEPCDDELPAFARLEKTYGDDVVFIAISDESPDVADAFLKAHGIDARLVSDPLRTIFGLYGVKPIPVTLVLGRDGTVGHVSVGELDWPELRAAVDAASQPSAASTAAPT